MTIDEAIQKIDVLPKDAKEFLMAYAVSDGVPKAMLSGMMEAVVRIEIPKSTSGIKDKLKKYSRAYGLAENSTVLPDAVLDALRRLAAETPAFASRVRKVLASKASYRTARRLFKIECNEEPEVLDGLSDEERSILYHRRLDDAWIRSRSPKILEMIAMIHLDRVLNDATVLEDSCAVLDVISGLPIISQQVQAWLVTYLLLRNDKARLDGFLSANPSAYAGSIARGMQALLAGNAEEAVARLLEARRHFRKLIQKNTAPLPGLHDLALQLARFLTNDDQQLKSMRKDSYRKRSYCQGYTGLWCWDMLRSGEDKDNLAHTMHNVSDEEGNDILAQILYWSSALNVSMDGADEMAMKLYETLAPLPMAQKLFFRSLKDVDDPLPEAVDVLDLSRLIVEKPLWQIRLKQMEDMAEAREKASEQAFSGVDAHRLVWFLNPWRMELQPQEQTICKNGRWSVGKNISLKRLKEEAAMLGWVTEKDCRIADCIRQDFSSWGNPWEINMAKAVPLLVGHPLVFDPVTREPWTIEQGELRVRVGMSGDECSLVLPEFRSEASFVLEQNENILRYYPITPEFRHVTKVLGSGFTFPKTEIRRVLDTLGRLGGVPFDTDVATEERPGDPTPIVQVRQVGLMFMFRIKVRPGGTTNPVFDPGTGRQNLMSFEDGAPVKYLRDLDAEKKAVTELVEACPALAGQCEDLQAKVDDPETALNVLAELRDCPLPHAVEWPEGEKLKIVGNVEARNINLKVQGMGGWFEVSGEVNVDEDLVIGLEELLEANARNRGRFVRLDGDRFLALTEDLKKKLDRLAAYTTRERGDRRLNAFAAGSIEEDLDGIGVDFDAEWKRLMRKIAEARNLEPVISPLLQADLRPYQRDGVLWMMRLAAMGMGACLADDMGLGKTVQATALLLDMAKKGPCLVVAPMSVCANWKSELARFAPSLETIHLGKQGTRTDTIQAMGPGMVLVISYSLLHIEQEELSSMHWATVIFDEAQSMKNAQTKRARAGSVLDADFRIALTGTPIENHMEDLWGLFNTILPGLLGSAESFRKRFGNALPGSQASVALRRLIRPFILRRMKSHVIEELPGRIEQTLIVEPNPKEQAFYEALRRNAKKSLANLGKEKASRIHILAELTRLRRACCHPTLADPQADIAVDAASSKTERLLELATELREGGHRMLVFSQFTGHLAIIRKAMEDSGFACLYLDGGTPEKKRAETVAEFQKGTADAFLISLKAGGLGLNLTAADYVIHMDPWWNPAVEDQASDRACRIGQKRPVTIYRMVMKDTVEEKILELHKQKKDLSASFLEGTDDASLRLTDEDLMSLL